MIRTAVATLLLQAVLLAAPASAQPGGEADKLFEEGRALAKDGKYAEACDRFARSFEIDRAPGTQLNLGDCHEAQGHIREARRLFEEAAASFEKLGDKRVDFARKRAAAVTAKLVTVIVKVDEPDRERLRVTIAGREVPASAEIKDQLDPGDVEVTATLPDQPPFTTTVKGIPGATLVVTVPKFGSAGGGPNVGPITGPGERTRRDRTRVRVAWALAGGGGVAGLAAIALTLKARGDYNSAADGADCDRVSGGIVCNDAGDAAIADAQGLADIGTGAAIAAGALIAAGLVVYVTAPREPVRIAPTATANSVGLSFTRRF